MTNNPKKILRLRMKPTQNMNLLNPLLNKWRHKTRKATILKRIRTVRTQMEMKMPKMNNQASLQLQECHR
jgi:hypothetical protein